jgi:hypothetical protein
MIIEGEEIKITSQKIMPKVQIPEERYTLKGEKVIVFPFSLSINGDGTIIQENNLKDENGNTITRFDSRAITKKGACADGIKLWGFSKNLFEGIKVGTKESRSGGHSRQETRVREFCYLNAFQTYYGIIDLFHPQEMYKEAPRLT